LLELLTNTLLSRKNLEEIQVGTIPIKLATNQQPIIFFLFF